MSNKNKIGSLILAALSSFSNLLLANDTIVKHQLAQMPNEDRKNLSAFLEKGLTHGCFPYTIFGDKPVSFEVYGLLEAQMGKKLWQQYHQLFQINEFIIKFQKSEIKNNYFVYLINKKNFLATVDEHLDLFKNILGPEVGSERLLHAISQEQVTFEEVLNNNEGLKGLLLGFGGMSSFQFQKRNELSKAICDYLAPPNSFSENAFSEQDLQYITRCKNGFHQIHSSPNEAPELSLKLKKIYEEFVLIQNKMQPCCSNTEPLALFGLPNFVGDNNDPEVQALLNKYANTRREIVQAFENGDFLEVALCKMAQE